MAKGLRAKSEKRKRSEKRKKMDAHDTLRNERLAKKMEDELASNIIQMGMCSTNLFFWFTCPILIESQ
jgi:hypothetical protein